MIRRMRLTSGLILLGYILLHFTGHASGLISLEVMEAMRGRVQWIAYQPWGAAILYAALGTHFLLAFEAIYRRRRLRFMTGREIWQLSLGLLIPFALVAHILATRGLFQLNGGDASYPYLLSYYWLDHPWDNLRQLALLGVAWGHAMIGLYAWLRLKSFWPRIRLAGFIAALMIPTLALLGVWQGAKAVMARAAADPAWLEGVNRAARAMDEAGLARLREIELWTLLAIAALLIAAFLARLLRALAERRSGQVSLGYEGGGRLRFAAGMSVLEAAREFRIPHASICGGRGRCSTCRMRVVQGLDALPAMGRDEARVLARVGAGPDVRLACQTRPPPGEFLIRPLLDAQAASPMDGRRGAATSHAHGQDMDIAVLFADLRGFTSLSESKLPYDVVFVLNRYFDCMSRAVRDGGGYLDKFIGDGVMALFGIDGTSRDAARGALVTAMRMAENLAELNASLAHDLKEPLKIGIGIHLGPAIVGEMGAGDHRHLTAIGDTVNTASRLESMTKDAGVQLILSQSVAEAAGVDFSGFVMTEMAVRGRREPISLYLVKDAPALKNLI